MMTKVLAFASSIGFDGCMMGFDGCMMGFGQKHIPTSFFMSCN
jgi:hypothetical protein